MRECWGNPGSVSCQLEHLARRIPRLGPVDILCRQIV